MDQKPSSFVRPGLSALLRISVVAFAVAGCGSSPNEANPSDQSGGPGSVVPVESGDTSANAGSGSGGQGGGGEGGQVGSAGGGGTSGAGGHAGSGGATAAAGTAGHAGMTGAAGAGGAPGTSGGAGSGGSGGAASGGSGTGGATIVDFAACTTCENQVCGAGAGASTSFVGQLAAASKECFTSMDVAAAGPAKGTPRSQLCQALLSCVHSSGCNKNASADQDCWCGIGVDATLCATASATSAFKPSGPCKQEIDAAAESSDPTIVPNRFTDTTFVSGDAFLLLDSCDNPTPPSKKLFVGKCQSECTASGAGGSSVGASGASGAGGSSVGASGASGASGSSDGEGSAGVGGGVGGSGAPTGAAGDPAPTSDAAIETGAAGVIGGAAGATGTAGAAGGNAGSATDASSGPAPIPEGGMPCAAPTGGMCPDLDGNSVLDCNETLVANPGFDTNISSWLPETGVSLTWDQLGDDNGNTSSGAIVVKNLTIAHTAGWTMEGTYECVPVEAGSTYDFTTQLSMPADQAAGGAGLIALLYYPSADCSGAPGGGAVSEQVTATATCEVLSMSRVIPSGIASASVRLTALKPFSADPFEVEFDNVLFKKH